MGEGEVLPTPAGRALKAIIEAGGRVGISSRGVGNGSPNSDGVLVISESYKLITFDVVADPSTFEAFQKKVSGKREHYEELRPVVKNEVRKANPDALVGFFGQLLEQRIREIKQKI